MQARIEARGIDVHYEWVRRSTHSTCPLISLRASASGSPPANSRGHTADQAAARRLSAQKPIARIGLSFLPVTLAMGTLSIRYSERIVMRLGARRALLAGMPLIMAGLLLFARVPVHGSYLADVLPSMLLLGIGAGIAFPALMSAAMTGATPADAGLASGLVNTTAQVGGALGLAVLATLSQSRSRSLQAAGHGQAAALTGGYQLAFWVAAALVGAAIAVVLVGLPAPAAAGEHVAAEMAAAEGAAEELAA